jgi:hypothetical protein
MRQATSAMSTADVRPAHYANSYAASVAIGSRSERNRAMARMTR